MEDESKVSVRPSGTEPEIACYFSVFEKLGKRENYQAVSGVDDYRPESSIIEWPVLLNAIRRKRVLVKIMRDKMLAQTIKQAMLDMYIIK